MSPSITLLLFLSLLIVEGYATLTPAQYWNMMLSDTPMPSAIVDLLQPGVTIRPDIMAYAQIGKDLNAKLKYELFEKYLKGSIPDEDIFFLEDAILPEKKLLINFTRGFPPVALLSREEANKIPFSVKKLPILLDHFSFHPSSASAESLRVTLDACELPDSTEKIKFCATSLESMVDFVISNFGTHRVWALSTVAPTGAIAKQKYVVASSPKMIGENSIVCHATPYPYSVFYCHVTSATRVYMVPLIGEDGTKVNAATVCHTDTSSWGPTNVAFRMFKVKPGKIPICHFIEQGGVLWLPRV